MFFHNIFFDNSTYDINSEIEPNRVICAKLSNNSSLKKTEKSPSMDRSQRSVKDCSVTNTLKKGSQKSKMMHIPDSYPAFQSPKNQQEQKNLQPKVSSQKNVVNLKMSNFSNELDNVSEQEIENSPTNMNVKSVKLPNQKLPLNSKKIAKKGRRVLKKEQEELMSNKFEESLNEQASTRDMFFSP